MSIPSPIHIPLNFIALFPLSDSSLIKHGCLHNFLYLSTQVALFPFSFILPRSSGPYSPKSAFERFLCSRSSSSAYKQLALRCLSHPGRRCSSKTRSHGHVFARLPCVLFHRRSRPRLELPYHWGLPTGHDHPWHDPQGMPNTGPFCFFSLFSSLLTYISAPCSHQGDTVRDFGFTVLEAYS